MINRFNSHNLGYFMGFINIFLLVKKIFNTLTLKEGNAVKISNLY
jgi:hypothetical protein